jgi:hypothetical protein
MPKTLRDKLRESAVLRYSDGKRKSSTIVRRMYMRWRARQDPPLPERCDNSGCRFHTDPLVWNGRPFNPILDHENGVNTDNRAKNLRLLCPLCDSQLSTRGGANKGRVIKSPGGFGIRHQPGGIHYTMPVEPAIIVLEGHDVGLWFNGERH